jgi:hypothetical protein
MWQYLNRKLYLTSVSWDQISSICASAYSCSHSSTAGSFQLGVVWPPALQPWSRSERLPPDCYMKNWLRWQHFNNNEELMEGFKTWLSSQAADFLDTGIQKLILRWWLCWEVASVGTYFLYMVSFSLIFCFVNSSPEVTFRLALVLTSVYIWLICVCRLTAVFNRNV